MAYLYFVVILAVTLQFAAASPRHFEGLTYIGSAPKSENPSTMATYYISNDHADWNTAFSVCSSMVGKLVSPVNPNEDDALRQVMVEAGKGAVIWTGGRKINSVWKWEPKDVRVYWSNWHSDSCELNTGCASAFTNAANAKWAWCGENCNNSRYYVCEF